MAVHYILTALGKEVCNEYRKTITLGDSGDVSLDLYDPSR